MAVTHSRGRGAPSTRRSWLGGLVATSAVVLLTPLNRLQATSSGAEDFVVVNGWVLKASDLRSPLDDR